MSSHPSERYADWRAQAEQDLRAATLNHANGLSDWCAYASAQAVEKSLKAVLVLLGISWQHEKDHHDLVALKQLLPVRLQRFFGEKALRELSQLTSLARYPDLHETGAPCTKFDVKASTSYLDYATVAVEWSRMVGGDLDTAIQEVATRHADLKPKIKGVGKRL